MNLKNKISLPLAAAAIAIGGAALGAGVIRAQAADTQTNPISNLVNAIAQKFNLNTQDVQKVFDEQHQQMEQQHQQQFTDRINQAVKDGKLTQEQADKIISKMQELDAQREADKTAMQNKTETERRDYIKQQMDNLQKWATDNNIPSGYLSFGGRGHVPGMGKGMHSEGGMMGGFGQQQIPANSSN